MENTDSNISKIYWTGLINDQKLSTVINEINNARKDNKNKKIHLYIQSEGGSPTCSRAFYNFIKYENIDLTTINMAFVASAATEVFLAGSNRMCFENANFLFHHFMMNLKGLYDEYRMLEDSTVLKMDVDVYTDILKKETKLTKKEIGRILKSGIFFDPQKAKTKGIVHEIIEI
jgi:ATP-dependent protease ClpP protease subunit